MRFYKNIENNYITAIGTGGGGGGGGGVLVVNVSQSGSDMILDKTYQEIYEASRSNVVIAMAGPLIAYLANIQQTDNGCFVYLSFIDQGVDTFMFSCQAPNDYPVCDLSSG